MRHLVKIFLLVLITSCYSEVQNTPQGEVSQVQESVEQVTEDIIANVSFLDMEIEETRQLIDLYKSKIGLLKKSQELNNKKSGSKTPLIFDPKQVDELVNLNEQALSHSGQAIESNQDNQYLVGLSNEKIKFTYDQDVLSFCFVVLKPINRASSGHSMSIAIVLAYPNGQISIMDIYGNKLLDLSIPHREEILLVRSSGVQDDPILSVLTASGKLHVVEIELHRIKAFKSTNETAVPEEPYKRVTLADGHYSKRYKTNFNQYEYLPKITNLNSTDQWISIDLNEKFENNATYENMEVFSMKGSRYIILSDNIGFFSIYKKDLSFHAKFHSGFQKINSIAKQGTSIIFTSENKIGFVKASDSSVGKLFCSAGLNQIESAVVDQTGTNIVYALTKQGEIYVFKSSNLLQSPDSQECKFLKKFTSANLESLANRSLDMSIKAIKGGIVVSGQDGSLELFNTTSITATNDPKSTNLVMVNQMIRQPALNEEASLVADMEFVEIKLGSFNFLLVRERDNTLSNFVMYETYQAYTYREPPLIDLANYKVPIFLFAFCMVMFYQFFIKKPKIKESGEPSFIDSFKKESGLKTLTPKMKDDLASLDAMMQSVKGLRQDFDSGAVNEED